MNLKGKKVLFIGPAFYNYHHEIISELKTLGATVQYYEERPNNLLYRIFNKLPIVKYHLESNYLNKLLKNIDNKNFDYFFLIRGQIVSEVFLQELKKKLPNAKFIMYQWDSVVNNNYINKIKYFDKVLTFDMVDAEQYNLEYMPLFYTNKYSELIHNKNKIYDIVFVGYFHSDRLDIIKKMIDYCNHNNLSFKYHLYLKKLVILKFLLLRKLSFFDLKYISTKSINDDELLEMYQNTNAVLDIESISQNGLTMRTMEVLGANLKLITTNQNIKKEPFFNSNNIFVLDRENLIFNKEFINENKEIRQFNYLLKDWIKKIFCL